jgi:hypothetical protein
MALHADFDETALARLQAALATASGALKNAITQAILDLPINDLLDAPICDHLDGYDFIHYRVNILPPLAALGALWSTSW